MSEYRYSSDAPTWSNAYLWPPLLEILSGVAPPPAQVFELGCGNGATARMLASKGYDVMAVDPSVSGIEIAKRHQSDRLHFAVGSTREDLGHLYGRHRVVLSLEVIEHCPSAREFMTAFLSLLEPGGVGIISTPYHGYLKNVAIAVTGKFDRHFDPLWEGGHLKFFSHAKLADLFREYGILDYEFHRIGRIGFVAKSTMAVIYNGERSQRGFA